MSVFRASEGTKQIGNGRKIGQTFYARFTRGRCSPIGSDRPRTSKAAALLFFPSFDGLSSLRASLFRDTITSCRGHGSDCCSRKGSDHGLNIARFSKNAMLEPDLCVRSFRTPRARRAAEVVERCTNRRPSG